MDNFITKRLIDVSYQLQKEDDEYQLIASITKNYIPNNFVDMVIENDNTYKNTIIKNYEKKTKTINMKGKDKIVLLNKLVSQISASAVEIKNKEKNNDSDVIESCIEKKNNFMLAGVFIVYEQSKSKDEIKNIKEFNNTIESNGETRIASGLKLEPGMEMIYVQQAGFKLKINPDKESVLKKLIVTYNAAFDEAKSKIVDYIKNQQKNWEKDRMEESFIDKTGLNKIRP